MTGPRAAVSVIIPVKDGARFLAGAIESVLSQSTPPLEVIVVDGGSSDRSAEIAGSLEGVRCLAQEGRGVSGAWNQGIEASKGGLVAFLDSDDRWLPGKLEAQVELLRRREELGGAVGLVRFFHEPGTVPLPGMRPELLRGEHPAPMPGALVVRRTVFERVGYFDPDLEITMDIDWFARVKDDGIEIATLPRVVIEKRFHDANLAQSKPDLYHHEMVRVFRDSAARQQARGEG